MTVKVYIAASLDGFIADPQDGLDWLTALPNPTGSDFGFAEFLSGVDAILMGRRTFEVVCGFGEWPYVKPVYVLSSHLADIPERVRSQATLLRGPVEAALARVSRDGHQQVYLDGGKLIQSCLRADLVDELTVTRVSILLGAGIPLFGPLNAPLRWAHVSTEVLTEDLVKSRYRRLRA